MYRIQTNEQKRIIEKWFSQDVGTEQSASKK